MGNPLEAASEHLRQYRSSYIVSGVMSVITALTPLLIGGWLLQSYIDGQNEIQDLLAAQEHAKIELRVSDNSDINQKILEYQLRTAITAQQRLVCEYPNNQAYKAELARLLTEYRNTTGRDFNAALLGC